MDLIRATRLAIETRSAIPSGAGMSISDFDGMLDMIAGGGAPSYTGKVVTPRSALGISACWGCVDVLASDWATLPVKTYRWIEAGVSREEARDHYLWPLFTGSANPHMSSHRFKYVMETWRNLWGNCYAEMEMNGRGQVVALWPWRPDRVKVWLEDPNDVRSPIFYTYLPMDRSKKPVTVPADFMLHVRGVSIDGITGLSPIEVHRQTLGLKMAMKEHSGRYYGQGAMIKGVFTHPGKLGIKGDEQMKKFLDKYQGLSNSHKTMVLEEGMTYKDVGMPQKDAQYIESENLTDVEIARIYKVPQHRVNILTRSTDNNIEKQGMEYAQYTLGPNSSNWCGEIHHSLLSQRELESVFVQSDFKYLLMADHAARASYYQALGNLGALGPDDIRHDEGRNPLPGGIGKTPRVGVNTMPLDAKQTPGTRPMEPLEPSTTNTPNGLALH